MIEIFSILIALFSNVIIVCVFIIPLILLILAAYILPAIGLYNLAKRAGYDKPWLAFIPIAQVYLEFVLPHKHFKVLFIDTDKRENAALITILVSLLGTTVIAGLNVIPAFGQILDVALSVFLISMSWRKKYDLLRTYRPEETAMPLSIMGTIIPLVYEIMLLVMMKDEPDYGFGNYYSAENNGEYSEKATEYIPTETTVNQPTSEPATAAAEPEVKVEEPVTAAEPVVEEAKVEAEPVTEEIKIEAEPAVAEIEAKPETEAENKTEE